MGEWASGWVGQWIREEEMQKFLEAPHVTVYLCLGKSTVSTKSKEAPQAFSAFAVGWLPGT